MHAELMHNITDLPAAYRNMSLPPIIVFLFSCLSLGMAASYTPFLEYGPPPVGVLHPTLREVVPLLDQPDLEQNLVHPIFPIIDQEQTEQPLLESLVQPQFQQGSNKPCFAHHKSALPCSKKPQLDSNKPCSGHLDSAQPCSQQIEHDSQQPCLGHSKSALPCSEQPEHGSQQPCSGHPKSAQPCSKPCSPCSEQLESDQPHLDRLENEQPSFGQPGSEQHQIVQPVDYPIVKQPLEVSPDQPIVVVRDGVGQYSVGHEIQGPDGQRVSEQGHLITTNGGWEYVIAKKGSYSYTSPEGILVSVDWEADHNGFRIIKSSV